MLPLMLSITKKVMLMIMLLTIRSLPPHTCPIWYGACSVATAHCAQTRFTALHSRSEIHWHDTIHRFIRYSRPYVSSTLPFLTASLPSAPLAVNDAYTCVLYAIAPWHSFYFVSDSALLYCLTLDLGQPSPCSRSVTLICVMDDVDTTC